MKVTKCDIEYHRHLFDKQLDSKSKKEVKIPTENKNQIKLLK